MDPARLTMELTESATLREPERIGPLLRELNEFGLAIAIDDFGAGWSSLSRLRQLPVQTLKIDRSFLREIPDDPEAGAIVRAVIALADALGMTTVAEGVEMPVQQHFLAAQGCPLAQGLLFGAALPAAAMTARSALWLTNLDVRPIQAGRTRADAGDVRPHRSLRALMVDVGPTHAAQLAAGLTEHGWRVSHEHVEGAAGLSQALQRRGWDAVLYAGDGAGAVPARKALALVRLADPHLTFIAVSRDARRGALSSVIRGLDGAAAHVSTPAELSKALERELDQARMRRRVGSAHQFLLAQQTISGHLAAGLDPDPLFARVLATLGETLGWTMGVVWRPDGDNSMLRCAGVWHEAGARAEVRAFADATRTQEFAPGQGMPGRVFAFRRPSWVPDISREGRTERSTQVLRAGLTTAVAFPLATGDGCVGVIEFFTRGVQSRSDEISAMFATVGGQVAQYLRAAPGRGGRGVAHARVPRRGRGADRRARRRGEGPVRQRPRVRRARRRRGRPDRPRVERHRGLQLGSPCPWTAAASC